MANDSLVSLKNAVKQFTDGVEEHSVLNDCHLKIEAGSSTALMGASGSGKSTLMNIIAGFEPLNAGQLYLEGQDTTNWHDKQWSHFRIHKLGVVFQQFNLLTPLNVRQNIAFPLSLEGRGWHDWCDYLVETLGLASLLDRHVAALSGGQQQRVAIARALASQPELLLADEPTGNLDEQSGLEVMELLSTITNQGNTAIVLVTHSAECASFMQSRLQLINGQLYEAS
ncbi:ABC transporter ATP-binding protein [Vibrio sp. SCSIO 43140]|uniref:ABC transporter ATP-binding protein n=1 Tax=Vibrio sp. SCSIO 43140 TaxID=2819100 RepID=UPI0020759C0E|nr:ABC transporter ATP-binding protein [Vibrio sp. SCSIO 43140]USD61647.1 ABC transporter ATP-binding protein [Vibrio sp. SCSIO 43140]